MRSLVVAAFNLRVREFITASAIDLRSWKAGMNPRTPNSGHFNFLPVTARIACKSSLTEPTMDSHQIVQLLGILAIVLAAARLLGSAARWIGQPAVLGELLAGVFLGASVLGLIDLGDHHAAANRRLPFLAGSRRGDSLVRDRAGNRLDPTAAGRRVVDRGGRCRRRAALRRRILRLPFLRPGQHRVHRGRRALTATSVGITARVLNDLGRLHEPESQIVLGAAVIDDILGLIILTVVGGLAAGQAPTVARLPALPRLAFGFLIGALAVGSFLVPPLARWLNRLAVPGMLTTLPFCWPSAWPGGPKWPDRPRSSGPSPPDCCSAARRRPTRSRRRSCPWGTSSCPSSSLSWGRRSMSALSSRTIRQAGRRWPVGGLLIVVAVLGKFAAGYAPFWFRGKKAVIGVGMIPRGEVGLIFAQMGLATGSSTRPSSAPSRSWSWSPPSWPRRC